MRTRTGQGITGFARVVAILIRDVRGRARCLDKKATKTSRHKPARRTIVFLEMP